MADRHHRHWTGDGKQYLFAVKDVWSNRIVGYSISDRMESRLAVNAVEMAVARRSQGGWATRDQLRIATRYDKLAVTYRAGVMLAETLGPLGGVAGTAAGLIAILTICLARDWTPLVDPVLLAAAPTLGLAVGIAAGLYPTARAIRIEPSQAPRDA